VLCDADGNLFGSEEPAFAASTTVTNDLLRRLGSAEQWSAGDLRRAALGRNFRTLARDYAGTLGVELSETELEDWVVREQRVVTRHLTEVLRPDQRVIEPLRRLSAHLQLAVVSSSALARLAACFTASDLDALLPEHVRFSAQDSLPVPTSKPDPAVYLLALESLALRPDEAVAVEDAAAGVASAVGAGIWTVGNLMFVPHAERAERAEELRAAGAGAVTDSWSGVLDVLGLTTTSRGIGRDPHQEDVIA
jgi:HAD superfamily hydrolase (TIGR01509 family)